MKSDPGIGSVATLGAGFVQPSEGDGLDLELRDVRGELQQAQEITLQRGFELCFTNGFRRGGDSRDVAVVLPDLPDGHGETVQNIDVIS